MKAKAQYSQIAPRLEKVNRMPVSGAAVLSWALSSLGDGDPAELPRGDSLESIKKENPRQGLHQSIHP